MRSRQSDRQQQRESWRRRNWAEAQVEPPYWNRSQRWYRLSSLLSRQFRDEEAAGRGRRASHLAQGPRRSQRSNSNSRHNRQAAEDVDVWLAARRSCCKNDERCVGTATRECDGMCFASAEPTRTSRSVLRVTSTGSGNVQYCLHTRMLRHCLKRKK